MNCPTRRKDNYLMDTEFIEQFVKSEFSRARVEDRQDLINTAWLFLTENNISQVSELTSEVLKKLKKHLEFDLNHVNWREIGIDDWQQRLSRDTHGFSISDDEKLSFIKNKSAQVDQIEIKQELEIAAAEFENQREELSSFLPPLLFEALHRGVLVDAPVKWTVGLEEQSLRILCWRALMRIKWIK